MLRGGDIKAGRISTDVPLITHEKDAEYARTRLEADDVVVALVGYPGESAIVPPRLASANISRAVGLLRLSGGLRPDYLVHFLNSSMGRSEFLRPGAGSAQMVVNLKDLNKLEVPCPPTVKEQEAIAEALSDADALIEGLERLIAKKRLIKQGAMQDLLTAKRRLPGFSGEWAESTIQDAAIVDPEALGASTSKDRAIRYISLEDVNRGALTGWTETTFGNAPSRARRVLREGDVLLGTVRPNLQSHYLFKQSGDDWIGSTGFAVLRVRPDVCSSRYLFELIMSNFIGRQIEELIAGSNYPAISNREGRKLQILVPPLDEQAAISSLLRDMDTEIQALATRLDKARQVKEGMMQNLLTGRIRLV
ncbi:restriction endonuclease subunit S (plasmid) [Paracoccus ferrooxidans]|nr:restriction endonuclease subunit S [Paracoccus ferrooxidans]